jgi:hypothetical protein
MNREEYEAKKKAETSRQKEKRESAESHARLGCIERREVELAKVWFFRHPDKTVKYTGYLQLFTAVLAVATIALFGATIYTAHVLKGTDEKIGEQVTALGRQLTLMEFEQRPWIKISDIKIVRPFVFGSVGDASVSIKIEGINVGKSVAFNVWPIAHLYVFADGKPSHTVPSNSDGACDPNVPERTLSVVGDSIFPNETIPSSDRTYALHIDQSEILAADATKRDPDGAILFFVIACVDYRVSEKHYKTGVTFMIGEVGSKSMGIIPANGKTISTESLHLIRVPSAFAR